MAQRMPPLTMSVLSGPMRITSLLGVVVKQVGVQPSASEELLSNIERNGFCLDVSLS